MSRLLLVLVFPLAVGVAVVALLAQVDAGRGHSVAAEPERSAGHLESVRPVAAREGVQAAGVLRRWDSARTAAWVAGEPARLARLYTPGSSAGRRDLALLRSWLGRGQRVRAVPRQLWDVVVLGHDHDRWLLRVRDRVPGVRDRLATWRIDLRRDGTRWVVRSLSRVPVRPDPVRPDPFRPVPRAAPP